MDSVVWQGSHMVGVGMEHRVVEQLVCWIKHGTEYAECTYQSPQSITVGRGSEQESSRAVIGQTEDSTELPVQARRIEAVCGNILDGKQS